MFHPIRALFWELLWNNRIVAPALALLFGLGAWMITETAHCIRAGTSTGQFGLLSLMAFAASVWLVYASFTLMESHHGWRMNSMTSRWFILPVRTWLLVAIPQLLGAASLSIVIATWWLLARSIVPTAAFIGIWIILIAAMSAMQAAAWATARKPWQFCLLMAALAFLILFVFLSQADRKDFMRAPEAFAGVFGSATVLGWLASYGLAAMTRQGRWPGYIAMPGALAFTRKRQEPLHAAASSPSCKPIPSQARGGGIRTAMLRADTFPLLRLCALAWMATMLAIVFLAWFPHRNNTIAVSTSSMLLLIFFNFLPLFGVIFLAPLSLVIGCAAPGQFRTQLNPFVATQPLTPGSIVMPKLIAACASWLIVWLPFLALAPWHCQLPDNPGDMVASSKTFFCLAWFMAVSAHAAIGALPIFLWGRLDGLPAMILATLGGWMCTWFFAGWLRGSEDQQPAIWILGLLLGMKLLVALFFLARGLMQRHVSMLQAAGIFFVWLGFGLGLAAFSRSQPGGHQALSVLLLLPLARLSACPLAVALNRHR